jgi:hypothetical protein
MPKIMVLAPTGGGKTSSAAGNSKLGIKGLSPEDTYWITATSKPLSGKGSMKKWPTHTSFNFQSNAASLKDFRRIYTNDPALAAHAITLLGTVKGIHNIILDDTNYYMQDMYMERALSTGWDAPKKIGYEFNKIFKAIERLPENKNFIMMAHYEEYKKVDGNLGARMKTTGNMVDQYVTPEGKFDIVLFVRSSYEESEGKKQVSKQFVTKDDGIFTSAKDQGIFDETYIPNDLAYVIEEVDKYYYGDDEEIKIDSVS